MRILRIGLSLTILVLISTLVLVGSSAGTDKYGPPEGQTVDKVSQAKANSLQGSKNVALSSNGGVASAKNFGTYNGNESRAYKAIDGDTSTKWGGTWTDGNNWLKVEFNKIYRVNKVAVHIGGHTLKYHIQVSRNGSNWQTVVPSYTHVGQRKDESKRYKEFNIKPVSAKYARMMITNTNAPNSHIWQYIVHEFEVYAMDQQGDDDEDVADLCDSFKFERNAIGASRSGSAAYFELVFTTPSIQGVTQYERTSLRLKANDGYIGHIFPIGGTALGPKIAAAIIGAIPVVGKAMSIVQGIRSIFEFFQGKPTSVSLGAIKDAGKEINYLVQLNSDISSQQSWVVEFVFTGAYDLDPQILSYTRSCTFRVTVNGVTEQ